MCRQSGHDEEFELTVALIFKARISPFPLQSRRPLHYAAYNNDREMASLLCDFDAEIEACDDSV